MTTATTHRPSKLRNGAAGVDTSRADAPDMELATAIALHLLPGVAILAAYLVLAPIALNVGAPALFALLIAATLVLVVFELGHLLRLGRRMNGRWSLDGVVVERRHTPLGRAIAWVVGTVVVAFVLFGATQPLDGWLLERAFSWLPDWYVYTDLDALRAFPRAWLIALFALRLPLDGLVLPWIEELYFRGYLQPRLGRFGIWAPLVGHGLFTIYHLWQPWNYPTVFIAVLPLAYLVWRTRDVRLGIAVHATVNVLGGVLTMLAVLDGAA